MKASRKHIVTAAAAVAAAVGASLVFSVAANANNSSGPGGSLAGARIDNFMLVDQHGVGHELYYHKQAPAIVLLTHGVNDAPTAQALQAIDRLRAEYEGKGVEFFALNSRTGDQREALIAAAASIGFPVLNDELQLVGRALGVTSTAEALVLDPRSWTVVYHGAAQSDLKNALDAILAGKTVSNAYTPAKGTPVEFPDRSRTSEFAKISYSDQVAPILVKSCAGCHTQGGIGPFALDRYEAVQSFAPMIREVLRTKRMPPYHADPHYGSFKDDMNMSSEEVLTVVNWIEAGAPRGSGPDVLAETKIVVPDWPLGKPDLILDLPAFDVPASGIVDYQDLLVANPLSEGKYIRAMTYRPGALETVHHIIGTWRPDSGGSRMQAVNTGGYGPGSESKRYPEGTGAYVPAGGSYAFQMHYTTTGKAVTDQTQVGLYFTDEPPPKILRQLGVMDFTIEIPPGVARHPERSYVEFPENVKLYGVRPHAHYRGYATKLTLRYPDGAERVLHNQPRYDFGWQREYTFESLIDIPKGSLLIADYIFDNSTGNHWNPDPKHNVTFGEQTMDEMLFTYVYYFIEGETRESPRDDVQRQIQSSIAFSSIDDNIDGKIQLHELRGPRMEAIRANFARLDRNGDGALDRSEFPAQSRGVTALVEGDLTATPE